MKPQLLMEAFVAAGASQGVPIHMVMTGKYGPGLPVKPEPTLSADTSFVGVQGSGAPGGATDFYGKKSYEQFGTNKQLKVQEKATEALEKQEAASNKEMEKAAKVVADAEADEILVPEPHHDLHGAYFTPAMELEAYLVEQIGINSGTGDYADRLIAAGISSPAQFAAAACRSAHSTAGPRRSSRR